MPSSAVKSFAHKAKKSIQYVEQIWNETKKEASKKFKNKDESYWAYVNKTTQYKLGIAEMKLSFKEFYLFEKKEKQIPFVIGQSIRLIKVIKGIDATIGEVFSVVDVDKNGDIKISNAFGPEYQDYYFKKENFETIKENK